MSTTISANYSAYSTMTRPSPSDMANKLFSKLDTNNQGYIDKTELKSALSQTSGASDSDTSAAVDQMFKQFDGNGDGKITKDEMTSGFEKLSQELDSQFNQMRMQGAGGQNGQQGGPGMAGMQGGGMAPPAAAGSSNGSPGASQSNSTNSSTTTYDPADTNQDGKVSAKEAEAYYEKMHAKDASASGASDASSKGIDTDEARTMRMIMQLMHAYGQTANSNSSSAASPSGFSATA